MDLELQDKDLQDKESQHLHFFLTNDSFSWLQLQLQLQSTSVLDNQRNRLLSLPNEILFLIMDYFVDSYSDLILLGGICKHFRGLSYSSRIWRRYVNRCPGWNLSKQRVDERELMKRPEKISQMCIQYALDKIRRRDTKLRSNILIDHTAFYLVDIFHMIVVWEIYSHPKMRIIYEMKVVSAQCCILACSLCICGASTEKVEKFLRSTEFQLVAIPRLSALVLHQMMKFIWSEGVVIQFGAILGFFCLCHGLFVTLAVIICTKSYIRKYLPPSLVTIPPFLILLNHFYHHHSLSQSPNTRNMIEFFLVLFISHGIVFVWHCCENYRNMRSIDVNTSTATVEDSDSSLTLKKKG